MVVGSVVLTHVLPVSSRFLATCVTDIPPAPPLPTWTSVFTAHLSSLTSGLHAEDQEVSQFRAITLNCGGAGDPAVLESVTVLICALDPDVVCLQELWDADPSTQIALTAYMFVGGTERGPGRGLWVLVHRRLRLQDPPCVVYDTRSWMAVFCNIPGAEALVVCNLHIDPSLS